jgi:3-isopropylmalate dehydrogenase
VKSSFDIAVLPGDGIGQEVMTPCLEVLDCALELCAGPKMNYQMIDCGAGYYNRTGISFAEEDFARAKAADAILLGAMGLPSVRYPDGREIAPQLELRERLKLYAGVRPIRFFPGVPETLAGARNPEIDFVLIRESTEGLFSTRTTPDVTHERAIDKLTITREVSERLFNFSFRMARQRKIRGYKGRVTCIDKANVLGSFYFFRQIFFEVAERYPDIEADAVYVDAMAMNLVKRPWDYDVMVTENMFGDILSDLGAGLIGGLGMAPSADCGDTNAVFQPSHGTAPDIMGQGKANPTAMFLSGAMMLDWLGEKHQNESLCRAAERINNAVSATYASGLYLTCEFGGDSGTAIITDAIISNLKGECSCCA